MADNPYLDPTDQQVPYLPPSFPQQNSPNLLQEILGNMAAGILGTTTPTQAKQMGMPGAAFLTPQQLQMLANAPERRAQLADIQSQTALRNQQAQWYARRPTGPVQNLDAIKPGSKEWSAMIDKVANGQAVMDDIFRGMSQGPMRARFFSDVLTKYPDWDPSTGIAQRQGTVSASRSQGAAQGKAEQTVGASVQAIDKTLNELKPLINKWSPSNIRIANQAFRNFDVNVNDNPEATQILGYLTSLRGFYASMLHGGGVADTKNEIDAMNAISNGVGKQGFKGVETFLKREGRIRMQGIKTAKSAGQDISLTGETPQSGASNGPKPGTVVDGYRFKGGDPNDENSWVKQ